MQYRVQTSMQTDNRRIVQVHGWVDADTHFDAAVQWKANTLAQPKVWVCLLYTSPSPRDGLLSRMPSSA